MYHSLDSIKEAFQHFHLRIAPNLFGPCAKRHSTNSRPTAPLFNQRYNHPNGCRRLHAIRSTGRRPTRFAVLWKLDLSAWWRQAPRAIRWLFQERDLQSKRAVRNSGSWRRCETNRDLDIACAKILDNTLDMSYMAALVLLLGARSQLNFGFTQELMLLLEGTSQPNVGVTYELEFRLAGAVWSFPGPVKH